MSKANRRSAAGVTLLEMLVAVSVLGIIATLLYATFARTLNDSAWAGRRIEIYTRARAATDWLSRDLDGAYLVRGYPNQPAIFSSPGYAGRDTLGRDLPLLEVTTINARGTAPLGGALDLPPDLRITTDAARVIYRVEEDRDAESDDRGTFPLMLVRYEVRPAIEAELEYAARAVVARNLADVRLRFFDGFAWFDDWHAGRGGAGRNRRPRAVEIRIAFESSDGEPLQFLTGVHLAAGSSDG